MSSANRAIPEQPLPGQHYLVLDVYRFVAALGVVLYHYLALVDVRTGAGISRPVENFHLLVDFFFILSGFVIALHYDDSIRTARDYAQYVRRRLARIYPLHILTLLATLAIYFIGVRMGMPVRDPARFEMSAIASHLTMTHAFGLTRHPTFNVPSWSLSAELFVYLLFPLLLLVARRGLLFAATFTALFIAAFAAARHALGLDDWSRSNFDLGAFRAVPSFLWGIVIAQLVRSRTGPALTWPLVLASAAASFSLLFLDLRAEIPLASFGLVIFLTARAEQMRPVAPGWQGLFRKLGTLSYGFYLWHIVIGTIVVTGGTRLIGESAACYVLLSLAALAISLAVADIGYRYFEKPMQQWILRRNRTARVREI